MISLARQALLLATFSLAVASGLTLSAAQSQQAPARVDETERAALREKLFKDLRRAQTEQQAQRVADRIWAFWKKGPDAQATQQIAEIFVARRLGAVDKALSIADALTRRVPDYAEGWNQKATLLFTKGEFDASLEAIERVLELEPKHFGALSGKAIILMHQGRMAIAQSTLRRAVDIHPFLNERHLLLKKPGVPI